MDKQYNRPFSFLHLDSLSYRGIVLDSPISFGDEQLLEVHVIQIADIVARKVNPIVVEGLCIVTKLFIEIVRRCLQQENRLMLSSTSILHKDSIIN